MKNRDSKMPQFLMTREGKEEHFFSICNSILKKEVEKGHLQWTIAEVARDAKVTRSLIYYYFGKEKKLVFEEAWKYMLHIFFDFSPESRELPLYIRMKNILKSIRTMPYLFTLFYLEKVKNTEIGSEIIEYEKKLIHLLAEEYPKLTKTEIKRIYLLELGAIAYCLDDDQTQEIFDV